MKDKIKELRIANNLSQTEFAEKIGVSRSSVSAWERGERSPDSKAIYRLCKTFNLDKFYFSDTSGNEIEFSRSFDISRLNYKGMEKLYTFYSELLENDEYTKKS